MFLAAPAALQRQHNILECIIKFWGFEAGLTDVNSVVEEVKALKKPETS